MTTTAQKRNAYVAWAVVCLVWGTTYLAIKVALETVPPFVMGAVRYLGAGIILTAVLALQGKRLPPLRAWTPYVVAGTLLLGVGNGFVILAEQWTPSGFAAVLVATTPFWMVGVEGLSAQGERLSRQKLIGLLIGFSGIILLVWPELRLDNGANVLFLAGVGCVQIACVGWAFGSVYARRHRDGVDPFVISACQMLAGGAVMAIVAGVLGEWQHITYTPRTGFAQVYLLVMGSLVAFVAYIYALNHLTTSFVSLYAYVNPVVAVILGTLILSEPFGWRIVLAIGVILAGMMVVSRKPASTDSAVRKAASGAQPLRGRA